MIASSVEHPPPLTLWVEWGFRSNQRTPTTAYTCDAFLTLWFRDVFQTVYFLGDAIVNGSGDFFVLGLDIDEFHTYRFESPDGLNYWFSVDGLIFMDRQDNHGFGSNYLQFGAKAGCNLASLPKVNEWDFIRYGTISYGEVIVGSDPPQGFVDARTHAPLDRFTVTYDSPNYVYINEISVDVAATEPRSHGATERNPNPERERRAKDPSLALGVRTVAPLPVVIATRRLDNGPPDVVEIVLDRPIPYNATTRFTFNDGVAVNVVEFTFAPGDTDGDSDADLHDFAAFQNCFEVSPISGACLVFDLNADHSVDLLDFAELQAAWTAP